MKKLLFGLMATLLLISGSSFGQTVTEARKKEILNGQMLAVVSVSKSFYVRGQSYNDFVKALTIPSPTVPEQDAFFRKVYFYVSNNTLDCDILKGDNSSLSAFAQAISQSPSNVSTPISAYSTGKKWWQIFLNVAVNLAIDVLVPVNNVDIDMWPGEGGGK